MIIAIVIGTMCFHKRVNQKKKEIEFISEKCKVAEKEREKIDSKYHSLRSEYDETEKTYEAMTKQLSESLKKYIHEDAENKVTNSELGKAIRLSPRFFSNDDWEELERLIHDNMTCFYELINDVQLSVQERQVCILTRLECSPQNIMIILNLSYSAGVSNVKRKVNMKLFHENNARTLFDNIMSEEWKMMSNRGLLV